MTDTLPLVSNIALQGSVGRSTCEAGVKRRHGHGGPNVTTIYRRMGYVSSMVITPENDIFFANRDGKIKKYTVDFTSGMKEIVGGEGLGYKDGPLDEAKFRLVLGMTMDANDNIVCVDSGNNCVRVVSKKMCLVSTIAGCPKLENHDFTDGFLFTACFKNPSAVVRMSDGNLVVSDSGNHSLRVVNKGQVVSTLCGTGVAGCRDGTGASAEFNLPIGIATDDEDNIYVR